ncbi:Uncharacterized protein FKW44_012042 [Caligus rogercresseyi]|uniref:Uncharacterized protein n=1 Tax=Caligus rogercresseyi TaxID=217165 RepID=A0A7T8K996_CALRO|nr:Uncharacterized protein FKW44_012042 [Caligus rogercresseyi]
MPTKVADVPGDSRPPWFLSPCLFPCIKKDPEERRLKVRSRQIDRQLESDKRKMRRLVKLLLLGAGESGKSTFLKQMKIIHGVSFCPDQMQDFRKIIFQNIIKGMRVLVDANRKLKIPLQYPENLLYGEQLLLFDSVNQISTNEAFRDFKTMINSLWRDPGIQTAFERRSEYQLTDSLRYFYDNLDRISDIDYVPSHQDILYCRKTTKGIIEFPLTISNVPFLFVDTKVVSVLRLCDSHTLFSGFFGDKRVNRLVESRNIFDTIINNRIFNNISFILFLNKMDLLHEKVVDRGLDISEHFPEIRKYVDSFGGDPSNIDDVKDYILYYFLSTQTLHSKTLYHHFTTAVNTRNIQFVFTSVKETILRKNLDALMLQ